MPLASARPPYHPRRCVLLLHVLRVLLLSAVLLVAAVPPPTAHAQSDDDAGAPPAPITLTADAAFGGTYRVSEWFPVRVNVGNDGADMQGTLEWRFPTNNSEARFQQVIDLPRGSRKQVFLYAVTTNFIRTGEVRLLDQNGTVVARQDVRLTPVEIERLTVGVLSSDPTLLSSLEAMDSPWVSGINVLPLDSDSIPEQAVALQGLDIIFIHDIDTAALSAAQQAAVRLWVELGGTLVLSGGTNAEQSTAGLRDILPVEVGALQGQQSLAGLTSAMIAPPRNPADLLLPTPTPTPTPFATATPGAAPTAAPLAPDAVTPPDGRTTLTAVTLREGAYRLTDGDLVIARQQGAGKVIYSAFGLAVLRTWQFEPDFWQAVLVPPAPEATFQPGSYFRRQGSNVLAQALQLPELGLPSGGLLVVYIGLYILIIGPLNFLLLRRFKRLDLAWITVPLTVLAFVLGTYVLGLVVRGSEQLPLEVTIVQQVNGSPQAQQTAFIGVFSPQRTTYTITMPAQTLASRGSFDAALPSGGLVLRWQEQSTQLPDIQADIASFQTFLAEHTVRSDLGFTADLTRDLNAVSGTLRNNSPITFEDTLVVAGDSHQYLGTFAPGDTQAVAVELANTTFPFSAGISSEDLIDRQQVLNDISAATGTPDPNGFFNTITGLPNQHIYLVGWQRTPSLGTMLTAGTEQPAEGQTLYIVQLD